VALQPHFNTLCKRFLAAFLPTPQPPPPLCAPGVVVVVLLLLQMWWLWAMMSTWHC
jgi:hypothetical protein